MAILYSYAGGDADFWRRQMGEYVPGQEFRVFPDAGDPSRLTNEEDNRGLSKRMGQDDAAGKIGTTGAPTRRHWWR